MINKSIKAGKEKGSEWLCENPAKISLGKTLRKGMPFTEKHTGALGCVRIRWDCIMEKQKAKKEKIFLVYS